MTGLMRSAESVLRGEMTLSPDATARDRRNALAGLATLIAVCGGLYGAAMGSFGSLTSDRWPQIVFAALKVPLLLVSTFALSLPSYFIFNTLTGLREDFGEALRALAASQAGLTVVLVALAPLTLLWNVSSSDHIATILYNALMFGLATVGGQILLRRYYRPLLLRDVRHKVMLRVWGVVYAFVGIQMGWILRPFVGDPNRAIGFFREDTWGNAYIIVFNLVWKKITK